MSNPRYGRATFTRLAELIGDIEEGYVTPDNAREYVMKAFRVEANPSFKPLVFHRHADRQRELRRHEAELPSAASH